MAILPDKPPTPINNQATPVIKTTAAATAKPAETQRAEAQTVKAEPVGETAKVEEPAVKPEPIPEPTPLTDKERLMQEAGIPQSDWSAVDYIVTRESSWRAEVTNPESGSHGLCQALPASKMASAGADYMSNPVTQLRWCHDYALQRYSGWWSAFAFWQSNKWW